MAYSLPKSAPNGSAFVVTSVNPAERRTDNGVLSGASDVAYASRMTDDATLMLRYAEHGDSKAFEQLYSRHKDPVYRYLLRHLGNADAADDVFQEVWSKVFRARHQYRPTAKFNTWLYRVAHNAFIDFIRRNRRHQGAEPFDETSAHDGDRPVEDQIDLGAQHRDLRRAIGRLPDDQRDAFLLHEEAGLSVAQIAEVAGVNPETAKSRIRYAVKKLRAALDERTGEEP